MAHCHTGSATAMATISQLGHPGRCRLPRIVEGTHGLCLRGNQGNAIATRVGGHGRDSRHEGLSVGDPLLEIRQCLVDRGEKKV